MDLLSVVGTGLTAALVAGVVSFVVAIFTNRAQDRRQQEQFEHDRAQRDRQMAHDVQERQKDFDRGIEREKLKREAEFRQKTYLDLAIAIGRLQQYFAASANSDASSENNLADIKDVLGELNKVHLVGSNALLKNVASISELSQTLSQQIGLERFKVALKKDDCQTATHTRDSIFAQREQLLALINRFPSDAGTLDYERFSSLAVDLNAAIDDAEKKERILLESKLALVRVAAAAVSSLALKFGDFVLLAREELNIGLSPDEYRSLLIEHQARISGGLEAQIFEMEKELERAIGSI